MNVVLLDTNVIIDSLKINDVTAASFVENHRTCCSVISRVEALGYHKLGPRERAALEAFFNIEQQLSITEPVVVRTIELRQQRNIKLGDALIAATALVHSLTLATRNLADFAWIDGLSIIDPYSEH